MISLKIKKYLFDILEALEKLKKFSSGKTFEDYSSDDLLRSAVERQFEIVGEALNQALKLQPDIISNISECKKIISFRNQLIHGYSNIENITIWGILENSTPRLLEEVNALLIKG